MNLKFITAVAASALLLAGCSSAPEMTDSLAENLAHGLMQMENTSKGHFEWKDGWLNGMWGPSEKDKPVMTVDTVRTSLRKLYEADGVLISDGDLKSHLNPDIADQFTDIDETNKEAHYIDKAYRLLDFKVVDPDIKTKKERYTDHPHPERLVTIEFRYADEPTELECRLDRVYCRLARPMYSGLFKIIPWQQQTSVTVYRSGYTLEYNPDTEQWEILYKANALYPQADGTIPYDCPYK